MIKDILYWIWLSTIEGIGAINGRRLVEKFGEPKKVFEAENEELIRVRGIGRVIANNISEGKNLEKAKRILDKCNKLGIDVLTFNDKRYEEYIDSGSLNLPILLYFKGKMRKNCIGVGIVGARRCTEYGKKVAKEAGEFLASNDIPVISGMAKGIDGYAHTACINSGGYTIAVLGCGVDICYPKEHESLRDKILENGMIVSEYLPETKPNPKYFPQRNKIISAFSKKILVVEASETSGALITAEFGKQMNKIILATPNSIYINQGKGCNNLIKNGAYTYTNPKQLMINTKSSSSSEDTLKEYKIKDKVEKKILETVKDKAYTLDEIVHWVNLDKEIVTEKLFQMELRNIVRFEKGKYCKCS